MEAGGPVQLEAREAGGPVQLANRDEERQALTARRAAILESSQVPRARTRGTVILVHHGTDVLKVAGAEGAVVPEEVPVVLHAAAADELLLEVAVPPDDAAAALLPAPGAVQEMATVEGSMLALSMVCRA